MTTRNSPDNSVQRALWKRHAHPRSVWTAVMAYPVLILAVYRRDRSLLGGTILSVAISLLVSAPPETDEAWATRVVLGEQIWLDRGLLSQQQTLLFTVTGGAVHLYAFRAALKQQPARTAVGTVLSLVLMFLFFDRMVKLYEEHGTNSG